MQDRKCACPTVRLAPANYSRAKREHAARVLAIQTRGDTRWRRTEHAARWQRVRPLPRAVRKDHRHDVIKHRARSFVEPHGHCTQTRRERQRDQRVRALHAIAAVREHIGNVNHDPLTFGAIRLSRAAIGRPAYEREQMGRAFGVVVTRPCARDDRGDSAYLWCPRGPLRGLLDDRQTFARTLFRSEVEHA